MYIIESPSVVGGFVHRKTLKGARSFVVKDSRSHLSRTYRIYKDKICYDGLIEEYCRFRNRLVILRRTLIYEQV